MNDLVNELDLSKEYLEHFEHHCSPMSLLSELMLLRRKEKLCR